MKNLLLIATFVLFLFACEEDNTYTINGKITGAENKTLFLDFLTLTEQNVIDTIETDENGEYQFNGLVSEKGFYRIRTEENLFWIFLLDNKYKLKIDADAKDPTLTTLSVSGNDDAVDFHNTVKFMQEQQGRLSAYQTQFQTLQSQGYGLDTLLKVQEALKVESENISNDIVKKVSSSSNMFSRLYLISFVDPGNNFDLVNNELTKWKETNPNSPYIAGFEQRVNQALAAKQQEEIKTQLAAKTAVGTLAPEIQMKNPQGIDLKLSDLRGTVVLVDFWASWCKPCRFENPNLVKAYEKFKDRGFTVFSVSLDKDRNSWVNAIEKDKLVWDSHVSDLKAWQNAAAKEYGVSGIPAAFLIDKEGNIIAKDGLRGAELEKTLEGLL